VLSESPSGLGLLGAAGAPVVELDDTDVEVVDVVEVEEDDVDAARAANAVASKLNEVALGLADDKEANSNCNWALLRFAMMLSCVARQMLNWPSFCISLDKPNVRLRQAYLSAACMIPLPPSSTNSSLRFRK